LAATHPLKPKRILILTALFSLEEHPESWKEDNARFEETFGTVLDDDMNYELLADVTQVIMGQSPPSSTYNTVGNGLPFYQGKTDFGDMHPTPRVYCTEPSRIAETGDILISVRAPVGPTNVNQERSCIGRGISAIRVGEKLDRDFLLYFLRFYEPELAKAGTGSTFAAIAREDLETIKIPLPPLTEQKRTASLLARADHLRQLRRVARDLGNSLLQSVFLEMFGDPDSNPRKWQFSTFGDLSSFVTSGSRGWAEYYTNSGARFIRVQDLRGNRVNFENMAYVMPKDKAEMARTKVKPYDLLLAITGATIGLSALVPENIGEAYVNQHVAIIRLKEKINHQYAAAFMAHSLGGQKQIAALQYGDTKPGMSLEQIKDLTIPLPPLNLQAEFAGVVARLDGLRGRMSEAGRQADGLFESLLSESFGG